jgi:hypothetical protein
VAWRRNEFDASVVSFKALTYPSGNCEDQRALVKARQEQLETAGTSELVWKQQDARRCEFRRSS